MTTKSDVRASRDLTEDEALLVDVLRFMTRFQKVLLGGSSVMRWETAGIHDAILKLLNDRGIECDF